MPGRPRTARYANEEIARDDRRSFEALYTIYEEMFPLPDEREPPEAFEEISALNTDAAAQRAHGPWREVVAAIRMWGGGPVVGGHIFGMTTSPAHHDFGCAASIQAIYTFLEPAARGGGGTIPAMKTYMRAQALEVFGLEPGRLPPLMFFEANNPLRMTAEEIAEDTARSGLSPWRRYNFWKRNGFAPLDFAYIQPRLRPDAEPVRYLDLFCSRIEGAVPSALVLAHLRAFVAISVRKGQAAEDDPDFADMAAALSARTEIGFVPDDAPEQRRIAQEARPEAWGPRRP